MDIWSISCISSSSVAKALASHTWEAFHVFCSEIERWHFWALAGMLVTMEFHENIPSELDLLLWMATRTNLSHLGITMRIMDEFLIGLFRGNIKCDYYPRYLIQSRCDLSQFRLRALEYETIRKKYNMPILLNEYAAEFEIWMINCNWGILKNRDL